MARRVIGEKRQKKRDSARAKRAKVAKRRLGELTVRTEDPSGYVRSKFGSGWRDNDSDGQNERAEVLISAHRPGVKGVQITYATQVQRLVETGRWRCRFSGEWYTDASELDIDHLVPLKEAWMSGANAWEQDMRVRYANGVGVKSWRRSWLLPVLAKLNRSKGAKRPDQWLPPNEHYWLNYAADWVATKHYWKMSVTAVEKAKLIELLNDD